MKTKLRRVAILALVLVLLTSNTMRANATTGDPTTIVDSYGALYTAIVEARDGDVIGVKGTISIPATIAMDAGNRYIVIKRMEADAKLLITGDYGEGAKATITNIHFVGNSSGANPVGGTEPFITVSGNVLFKDCDFEDCFNQGSNGGAVYVESSGNATLSYCRVIDNCADYGGAIFNDGTLTLEKCILEGNWAEEIGGAIYNAGTLTIKNTELKGNTARRIGGGLYNNASTELYSSLVWNNTASIHGSDIANEGSLSDYTTDEEYNTLLNRYSLYYGGWEDELDTSVGGTGEYKKLITTDTAPIDPSEPTEPTDPEEPDEEDNTGGDTEDGGTTTPEEPDTGENEDTTTPDGGDDTTDPAISPDEGGDGSGEDPVEPDTPSDTGQGDNIDNSVTDNSDHSTTDNSTTDNNQSSTDNSVTDNSTTDNSTVDSSITDNSTHTEDNSGSGNTTDNSQHSSTVDNSSVVSNTDNSSSKSESSNTENSNNTTTYNYYQTDQDKGSTGAPQSISQPITVNVTVPQAKEPETGTQEPTEASQSVAQNIHIEAEGVNVKYEYTADGVSISISPYIAPESPTEAEIVPTAYFPVETPQEPAESPISWVDYVSMILLAILVLSELRDRWFRLKNRAE